MNEEKGMKDRFIKINTRSVLLILFILSYIIVTLIVASGVSERVDYGITKMLYDDFGKDNHDIMLVLSFFGGYYGLIPGSLFVITYLFCKHLPRRGTLFAAMMLSSVVLFMIFKLIIGRPRPDFGLLHPMDHSYPSGHATASFVFYIGAYFFLIYKDEKGIELTKLLSLSAVPLMIGISRLFLALHYPIDIIGGFLLGGCVLSSFYLIGKSYDVL